MAAKFFLQDKHQYMDIFHGWHDHVFYGIANTLYTHIQSSGGKPGEIIANRIGPLNPPVGDLGKLQTTGA